MKRANTPSTVIDLTIAKRWSGTTMVDLTIAKRWDGVAWVDMTLPGGSGSPLSVTANRSTATRDHTV